MVTTVMREYEGLDIIMPRAKMIEKLEKDLIQDRKDKQIPAIASAIMHSEFYKSKVQSQNSRNQNWKNKMDSV